MSIAITREALGTYLRQAPTSRTINEVVLHHTWSPTAAQYRGQSTWDAIRRYHVETNKWSDIGYHFGIGPDLSLWRLRPVEKVGAHVLGRNAHTIGLCVLGNYDAEDPAPVLPFAATVAADILRHYHLGPAAIRFHREFQNKSCPGTRIVLADFRQRVQQAMSRTQTGGITEQAAATPPPLAVVLNGQIVECSPVLTDGRLRVFPGPYCAALGSSIVPEIAIDATGRAIAVDLTRRLPGNWVLGPDQYRVTCTSDGLRLQRWYPQKKDGNG